MPLRPDRAPPFNTFHWSADGKPHRRFRSGSKARKNRRHSHRKLFLEPLERRQLLAADTPSALILIDEAVLEDRTSHLPAELLEQGSEHRWVTLVSGQDPMVQISDALQSFRDLDTIAIVAHGNSGGLSLANQYVDAQRLLEQRELLSQWDDHLSDGADILLFSCEVAQGERGDSFIQLLSQLSGADVAASVDRTGSSTLGANWNLERSTGPVSIDTTLMESIEEEVAGLLPITIYAAGETGQEEMELRIDGQVVATWNNIGGEIYAGVFQTFTYDGPTAGLTPERIRVAFTNDLFVEGLSDRNLRVDRIVVDGTTFETEAPTVYSTGTWKQEDGIVPGFRQSEFLQSDGYFQYAVVNNGSIIEVYASGQVGPEAMTLRIDDKDVASWAGVGAGALTGTFAKFTYQASGSILPSQVKVAFTNDLYSPPTDYNLRVDRIVIDGVSYQTEAPTVYSTGTYVAAQNGIVAGYPQSEWLHSKGYFQYGAKSLNPGYLGLESSVYTVNEGSGSVSIAVVRTFGKDGEVSIDYKTASGTATSPADFTATNGTLRFADGEVRKTIVIPIINDTAKEPPEGFNLVIENPKGGATLLAPRTATATIQDDDLVLPNYSSFPNTTGLKLNGNASIASGTLQLTANSTNRRGSAFYTTPIPLLSNTSFQTQFVSKTTGTTNGGEGFTFVIQNASSGTSSLGTGGSSLGYAGIAKSLAIEFDTNANAGEINNNHISIWRDGSMVTSLATSAVTVDFNSGNNVYTWIDYYGDSDQLSLFVSNTTTKPATPITTLSLDLFGMVGSQAYFGFSAATGSLTNAHQIVSWNLNLNRPASPAIVPAANLVSETVISGLIQPIAVEFSPDGRNTYVAQKAGQVMVVRDGVTLTSPFIDISGQVNNHDDRGLLDIALHPDFPNTPYLYLLYTYDPPQVYQNLNDELAGPDKGGNRAGRLIRVTADAATNYTTALAGSEVVLLGTNSTWANFNAYIDSTVNITEPPGGTFLNGTYVQDFINSDSSSHTVASLMFGVDGALYVSIGDGASYNTMDPRAVRVQDIDNLSGKLLRIDPLTGLGYPNNPYQNGNLSSNRSKVYQLGLRNPFRMATNPNNGKIYIGDVGWTQWEEINSGAPGANFGWPYFEGGNGVNLRTTQYESLPQAQAFYASGQLVTPSLLGLNHAADGINAVVMGDFYTGTTYPAKYLNNLFFNDLGQGIVRNIKLSESGQIAGIETFATGAVYVVQIVQGRDGNLYYVDLDDGTIGRWRFVPPATPPSVAMAASAPLESPASFDPVDVNQDGFLTPLDSLLVLNHLNRKTSFVMASDTDDESSGFELDVNQDGMITPNDALFVINRLNRKGSFVDLADEWLHEDATNNQTDSEDGSSAIAGEGEWMESLAINLFEQDRARRKR